MSITLFRSKRNGTTEIHELSAGFEESKKVGKLFTLEEFPKVFNSLVNGLENTKAYKLNGYVFFYLDTIGTNMNGYYKFNPAGKTVQEMFQQVSEMEYRHLPFENQSYIHGGSMPLRVFLEHDSFIHGGRLNVLGDGRLGGVAPVVVTKHPSSSQAISAAGTTSPIPKEVVKAARGEYKAQVENNTAIATGAFPAYKALLEHAERQH
ncbi:MAG: hypothetical protein KGH64_00050 [Candidatus Micrarchaeota archaeon]|nr:hypothetical protein [Candidatus Micrarchaeota archaeon]MDE1833707.1 hypothetical protein [Candidatus Micrarchaeota archaeon]MDE1859763.1 hypothetical protein [Candidatus Micrarchaeota archaeon]